MPTEKRKRRLIRLVQRDGNRCFYCGVDFDDPETKTIRTIDHKVSEHQGGSHDLKNLVLACAVCNRRKGSGTAREYLESETLKRRRGYFERQQKRKKRRKHEKIWFSRNGSWTCVCGAQGKRGQSPTLIPCDRV